MMRSTFEELILVAGFLGLLLISLELGYRAGRRSADTDDGLGGGPVGAIQGAILGLLGLLLAFSFSAAGSRFLERQDLIAVEANAIGTATLRADLLDEPHRTSLRTALRDYTLRRIELTKQLRSGLSESAAAETDRHLASIWSAAMAGVRSQPTAMLGILPPVNEVIDLHTLRVNAGRKHLPALVMGLLVACSALALAVIGYSAGVIRKRRTPLTMTLAFLIAASLWITYDLDHPRAGLLQLNDRPLRELKFD